MKLFVCVLMSCVAALVTGQETTITLETAVNMDECLRGIEKYTCTSDHGQGIVNIAVQCGPDHIPSAENQVAQCTSREACLATFSSLNVTEAKTCSDLELGDDTASCTSACQSFLQKTMVDVV